MPPAAHLTRVLGPQTHPPGQASASMKTGCSRVLGSRVSSMVRRVFTPVRVMGWSSSSGAKARKLRSTLRSMPPSMG